MAVREDKNKHKLSLNTLQLRKTRAPSGVGFEQEITYSMISHLVFIGNFVKKATGAGTSRRLFKTKGLLKLSKELLIFMHSHS